MTEDKITTDLKKWWKQFNELQAAIQNIYLSTWRIYSRKPSGLSPDEYGNMFPE